MKLYKEKANLYDRFISQTGKDYREVARFISGYLKGRKSILELGGGTGRYSVEFNKLGFDVVCSDINEEMLEIAKKNALNCIRLDMKNFNLERKFDVILSLFNTITYNTSRTELEKNIKCCFNNLNNDGLFVIEITNPTFLLEKGKNFSTVWNLGVKKYLVQLDELDKNNLTHTFIFVDTDLNEVAVDKHFTKIFRTQEIMEILKKARFKDVSIIARGNVVYIFSKK